MCFIVAVIANEKSRILKLFFLQHNRTLKCFKEKKKYHIHNPSRIAFRSNRPMPSCAVLTKYYRLVVYKHVEAAEKIYNADDTHFFTSMYGAVENITIKSTRRNLKTNITSISSSSRAEGINTRSDRFFDKCQISRFSAALISSWTAQVQTIGITIQIEFISTLNILFSCH